MVTLAKKLFPLLLVSNYHLNIQVLGYTIEEAKRLISLSESTPPDVTNKKTTDPNPDDLNFYGKIVSICDFNDDDCFNAVVTSGRTNFYNDGGDLANIYVPANDYDTWRQNIPNYEGHPIEGDFVYQLQNDTLSCLTIELKWSFATATTSTKFEHQTGNVLDNEPVYSCHAVAIASNWDCHLDWSLAAECSFNSTLNLISAVYTVTNLGPEQNQGNSKVAIFHKQGNEKETSHVIGL